MRAIPYAAVVLSFAVGLWQKWPCHSAGWPYDPQLIFGELCYSDLPVLFADRGLADGYFPYATARSFEYPVLTGHLADITARMAWSPQSYFLINLVVLLLCTMVTVWATIRLTGRRSAGLIVALSPVLVLTGTINWDMVPVMLVSLAMLAWARDQPALAGLAIGLGAATKLYPALLLFPLFLLTIQSRQWRGFLQATGVAVVSWAAANLPVMLLYPAGWAVFWELNADRPADFGSLFYALNLLGYSLPLSLNTIGMVLFGLCLAAMAFFAPRRLEVLTLLTVAAFLITNKVYSPQYALWLLPLAVAAGASLMVLIVWQLAEALYWWAVWNHLSGTISDDGYSSLIFVRIGAELLLCAAALTNRKLLPGHSVSRDRDPAGPEEVESYVTSPGRV